MDVLPVRPAPTHRPRSPATHSAHASKGAHATQTASSADDLALIAQQSQFDMLMQARAEGERQANALRDLAMEQLKHDDSAMHAWIKMI